MNLASLGRHAPVLSISILLAIPLGCREQAAGEATQTLPSSLEGTLAAPIGSAAGNQVGRVAITSRRMGERPAAAPGIRAGSLAIRSPSLIIRTGDVTVRVDSLEAAMEAVRRLATSLGGYIGNVSINTGRHQVRSASLEMKIPASRFDDALTGMKPLGEVESSTATAQDVGEEFVDVSARVANAKRLEARLVSLLATRTGKLEDVLAVERELARVREEIERYEGRIRYLSSHVATSTIVATVHEKPPLVATQPGRNPIGQAFVNMWRNFVLFVAWGIETLGVVIPLAVLALLIARTVLFWRRRSQKIATA